jgi:hypothetical protein
MAHRSGIHRGGKQEKMKISVIIPTQNLGGGGKDVVGGIGEKGEIPPPLPRKK